MIDFNDGKRKLEQEQAEAEAWEADLRNRAMNHPETISYDEINILAELNESFVGDYMDEKAKERYDQICDLAHGIIQESKYAQRLTYGDPERTKRHASVYLDMGYVMAFYDLPLALLKTMIELSDDFGIAYSEDHGNIRLSFTVRDVWKKNKNKTK